ncbi:hypothetical protein QW060_26575 [Myroides ceti]|uniref:Uncharacterized protein n=1 Tax=Paenimyroides ceti TaxID=395087 RepID=A0ABT8D0Q0_9FLAO|nr:hypothetical protein [Paenimyroides ceti]MDN3710389.1 hypothetical protein [Paenimyroides ceti]
MVKKLNLSKNETYAGENIKSFCKSSSVCFYGDLIKNRYNDLRL